MGVVGAARRGVRRLLGGDARDRLSAPAEGFPLVSLPRFLLADFPLFLALASLTLDRPRARDAVLVTFAALGAVAAAAFARAIWIA